MKKTIKYVLIIFIFSLFICLVTLNKPVYAEAEGLTHNYTYNIINKSTGKCLNVNYGTDADGTNVTQFTDDGSYEQKFAISYEKQDGYKIYAICSSEGWGRVLDVYRPLQNNANVDIWANGDDEAQYWKIIHRGDGYYSIHLLYNESLALTAVGSGNGSGSGTSSTSNGNVIVKTYTGANNQLWSFRDTSMLLTWDLVNSERHLYWNGTSNYIEQFRYAATVWNNFIWTISPATSTSGVNLTISDYTDVGSNVVGVTSSAGTIKFNTYYMDQNTTNQKRNTCIHELGHALGLKHRRELDSVMYKSVTSNIAPNEMDEWNYAEAFINY